MNLAEQILRIIFFRANREDLTNLGYRHLAIGMLLTWIVGLGRYWDDPRAYPLQHLGLVSVLYVFFLTFLLWLVILPLRPENWSYRKLLTYVTLTSPPAIIYAIPVEKFLSLDYANLANFVFLIIVALWRMGLMSQYLRVAGRIPFLFGFAGMLFPITSAISLLIFFDEHRAVFDIMGGFRHHVNPHDLADVFLELIAGFSTVICPVAAVIYTVIICWINRAWLRDFITKQKLASSLVVACIAGGITYGIIYTRRATLDELKEQVNSVESPQKQLQTDNESLKREPNNARLLANRAMLEEWDGHYTAALDDYSKALKLNNTKSNWFVSRAFLLNELGKLAESIDDLRSARRISNKKAFFGALTQNFDLKIFGVRNEGSANAAQLAPSQMKQGAALAEFCDVNWFTNPEGSIEAADTRSLIKEIPMLWQLQRFDDALEDCNKLVERAKLIRGNAPPTLKSDRYVEDAALVQAYRMRGYTYELSKQNDKAMSDYNQALSVVRDDQQSLFLKGRLLKELGQEEEARKAFLASKEASKTVRSTSSWHNIIPESPTSYQELLTLAALGEKKEAAFLLLNDTASKSSVMAPDKKSHVGRAWSSYLTDDDILPAILWETGKFYEILGMNDLAKQRFDDAIAFMDKHKPTHAFKLNYLLWRTRILLSLGEEREAEAAFEQAKELGYAGARPKDDMSSIDANLLVVLDQ